MDRLSVMVKSLPMLRAIFTLAVLTLAAVSMFTTPVASQQVVGAQAEPVLLSHEASFDQPLSFAALIHMDPSRTQTLDDVLQEEFTPLGKRYIDFGLSEERIWVKVSLQNATPESGIWRLDFRRQFLQELDLYLVSESGLSEHIFRSTSADPFNRRLIHNRYLATDISVEAGEAIDIYVSYTSSAATWLPLRVMSLEAHTLLHRAENRKNWLINGALMAMFILAALVAPIVRWQVSFTYCFYLLSGGMFVLQAEGYAFQFLWPNFPSLYDPLGLTLMLLMSLSGPLFARFFFQTKIHFPRFDRVLIAAIVGSVVLALLSIPLFKYDLFKMIAYPFVLISSGLHLTTGVLAYRHRLLGSLPFLVGSVLVFLSLLYALFAHARHGWINLESTLDVGHFTLFADAICFAAAIVVRLLGVRRERDRALQAELSAAEKQVRLEQDLRRREQDFQKAQIVSTQRKEQLASVKHDIRQPLLSLRHAMERLGEGDEETSAQVHAAFDYLEDLARKTSGASGSQLTVSLEHISLTDVLGQSARMFAEEAAQAGIEIRTRLSDDEVVSDPVILMRIINNLVANAIRHSGASAILLTSRLRGDKVVIDVWDNGTGISAGALSGYLQPGKKGTDSTGSGLGLAIAKTAADTIGASLDIASREGIGTRARLTLATGDG